MQVRNHSINKKLLMILLLLIMSSSYAGPREQAKRMHDRLVGVPPDIATLDSMSEKITNGDSLGAALEAMENPVFYNTILKDYAASWTNREQSVYVDLNDSTATVIGMIRDDVPFNQILSENIVYVGASNLNNVPAYSQDNNEHYRRLESNRVDLSDQANLVRMQQTDLPGNVLPANATAGIMTTRGFSEAFLIAGTNRAAVRFASVNFLCRDMEDLRDVTARPDFIRQDVTRAPGGDSRIFLNDCLTCHAGMDALAGAFAYYDFNDETNQIVYTNGIVQPKYLRDAGVFRFGHATQNDVWLNYWRVGPNAYIDWRGDGAGIGAKSLGMELANTRQFAECQVRQVFEKVCFRPPNGAADHQQLVTIATIFENNNYSMKRVFAETATYCMGE